MSCIDRLSEEDIDTIFQAFTEIIDFGDSLEYYLGVSPESRQGQRIMGALQRWANDGNV